MAAAAQFGILIRPWIPVDDTTSNLCQHGRNTQDESTDASTSLVTWQMLYNLKLFNKKTSNTSKTLCGCEKCVRMDGKPALEEEMGSDAPAACSLSSDKSNQTDTLNPIQVQSSTTAHVASTWADFSRLKEQDPKSRERMVSNIFICFFLSLGTFETAYFCQLYAYMWVCESVYVHTH